VQMTTVLQVSGLTKTYSRKGKTFKAVDNISFTVGGGEIVGVLGPNGSGKTTTLKSICGLTGVDAGEIRLNGDVAATDQRSLKQHIGAVLEGARNVYWRLTPSENIVYFAGLKGVGRKDAKLRAEELITILALSEYRDQEVRMLSKGNQQKVAIACALVHRPCLILLDEPTLGLDVDMVRGMKSWLRTVVDSGQSAIMITSHDMDFIEAICDRVVILYRGEIISENSVAELRRRYAPQKTFLLQVQGCLSPDVKRTLQQDGWAVEESENSSQLSLRTHDLLLLSSSLIALTHCGAVLTDINVSSDTLEDIFVHAVQGDSANETDKTVETGEIS
jgi:ABC-2 type transport system ATP-binding protein